MLHDDVNFGRHPHSLLHVDYLLYVDSGIRQGAETTEQNAVNVIRRCHGDFRTN